MPLKTPGSTISKQLHRRPGRPACPLERPEYLFTEIAAENPVIVLQNLGFGWWPRRHYAVVVGYDLPARRIILHTGGSAGREGKA